MKRTVLIIGLCVVCIAAVIVLLKLLHLQYPLLVLDLEAIPVTGR